MSDKLNMISNWKHTVKTYSGTFTVNGETSMAPIIEAFGLTGKTIISLTLSYAGAQSGAITWGILYSYGSGSATSPSFSIIYSE